MDMLDSKLITKLGRVRRAEEAKAKLATERAQFIFEYQRLYEEFHKAIDGHAPQTDINLLRKKLNNARVRVTPWLKEETA
jgi:hypothetical protein